MDKFTDEQQLEEAVLNIDEEGPLFEEVEEETFGDSVVPMASHHHTHGYDDTEEEESEE